MGTPEARSSAAPIVPSFEKIPPVDRDKLLRLYSGREDLAREFWDDVANEVDICAMFGAGIDLETKKFGGTPSTIKTRMEGIGNSARWLIKSLDDDTCEELATPPDGLRHNSLDRKERRMKLELLKLMLADLVKDADQGSGWDVDRRLFVRLDYVLASTVEREVECSDLRLSAPALLDLVFNILKITTTARDAIKGARRVFRRG